MLLKVLELHVISAFYRSCQEVQLLTEAATGITAKSELRTLIIQSTIVKTKLDEMVDKKERNVDDLREQCKTILSDIEKLRENINSILDKMETKTIEELDKVLEAMDEVLQHDLSACKATKDDLQKSLREIEERMKASDTLTFVSFKRCEAKLSDARCLLKNMPDSQFTIIFREYNEICQNLNTLQALGEFEPSPWVASLPPIRIGKNHVYKKVGQAKQYDVRLNSDRNTCAIVGCCKLSNGLTVLADCDNKKLKLLNEKFEIISHYETKGSPYHMCMLGGRRVAVSVDEDYSDRIYILDVIRNRISLSRKFGLNHPACGLAYCYGQILVGSDTAIYVYTTLGKLVKKLYEDRSGSTTVWRFAFGEDSKIFYVPNVSGRQLNTIDVYGNKLTTFKESGFKSPEAVCVAGNGNVFVCDGASNSIIQLDRDGRKKISKVADGKDGVASPRSLWYHGKTSELIVGQWDDNIMVFQLY